MRQRRDCTGLSRCNLREASEAITAVDVHGARSTDPLTARSPEGKCGINLVLDLDQGVENHGATFLEINLVILQFRFRWIVGIPSVD